MVSIDQLLQVLEKIGPTRRKFNIIKVLLKDASVENRQKKLQDIQKIFEQQGAVIKQDNQKLSTVGYVYIAPFKVCVKPEKYQGLYFSGINNENVLVNAINDLIKKTGSAVDIMFYDTAGKEFEVLDSIEAKVIKIPSAVEATRVGAITKDRRKADVQIKNIDGKLYKFSLKQDNSEYWGSGDTYFGEMIRKVIDREVENKRILLSVRRLGDGFLMSNGQPVFQLKPEIYMDMTVEEKQLFAFGSDIKSGEGAILRKTFTPSSFTYENGILKIACTKIYLNINDIIGTNEDMILIVYNIASGNVLKIGYRGMRTNVVTLGRKTSTMLKVNR